MADPFPSQYNINQAIAQADVFAQQTRARMQMQMQMHAAAMSATGGAQPGIIQGMRGMYHGVAGQAAVSYGNAMAAIGSAAIIGQPAHQNIALAAGGARYDTQNLGMTGLMMTGYAPLSLFPHAGASFAMQQDVRRERAREEVERRFTMMGRGMVYGGLSKITGGLSEVVGVRTGWEASWFSQMATERTMQQRMGFMRGGEFGAEGGFGVNRQFFTRGPGREGMRIMTRGAADLQREFGYNVRQLETLTNLAVESQDFGRTQRLAQGGAAGVTQMHREINETRRQLARAAREMEMTEPELQNFTRALRRVADTGGGNFGRLNQQFRQIAMQGPFSQRAVAEGFVQAAQLGTQLGMGGQQFGLQAMRQANQVAELQRRGVIGAETFRMAGLDPNDPQAAMHLALQRLQQNAQAVQAGNFNQALLLRGGNQGAYNRLMRGGTFFETQAAVGATLARDPFALLKAQLDPNAVRDVTMNADLIAFQTAQQNMPYFMGDRAARTAQGIKLFGQQAGIDVSTPAGLQQAKRRYNEQASQMWDIQRRLERARPGFGNRSLEEKQQSARDILGFMAQKGFTMEEAVGGWARSGGKAEGLEAGARKERAVSAVGDLEDFYKTTTKWGEYGYGRMSAGNLLARTYVASVTFGTSELAREIGLPIFRGAREEQNEMFKKIGEAGQTFGKRFQSEDMISRAVMSDAAEWRVTNADKNQYERLRVTAEGKQFRETGQRVKGGGFEVLSREEIKRYGRGEEFRRVRAGAVKAGTKEAQAKLAADLEAEQRREGLRVGDLWRAEGGDVVKKLEDAGVKFKDTSNEALISNLFERTMPGIIGKDLEDTAYMKPLIDMARNPMIQAYKVANWDMMEQAFGGRDKVADTLNTMMQGDERFKNMDVSEMSPTQMEQLWAGLDASKRAEVTVRALQESAKRSEEQVSAAEWGQSPSKALYVEQVTAKDRAPGGKGG